MVFPCRSLINISDFPVLGSCLFDSFNTKVAMIDYFSLCKYNKKVGEFTDLIKTFCNMAQHGTTMDVFYISLILCALYGLFVDI
ncbi:MAG: hypothetical protein BWX62_00792 [Bacteroidetes bacterium ADurb.Bin037]|nr:MAG: hypothetical protein BWX62_00792 [Bacteroidetes bacterium ADurb.Bin037]